MIYHVSPHGSDQSAGTRDNPVKTPEKALALAREQTGDRTILIEEGVYEDVSLILDERDSNLTIQGNTNALLCAGKRIDNWSPYGDGSWYTKLPNDFPVDFRMIMVNGRFAQRSRFPLEGRLEYLSRFNANWLSTSQGGWDIKPTARQLTTLEYDPADIGPDFDWRNAELTIFHKWDETMTGISAHDTAGHAFELSVKLTHPPGAFKSKTYIIWNTRDGMAPGKWRVDKAERILYYQPLDHEDMSTIDVVVPVHQSIITIKGGISRLTVRDVCFSGTSSPMIPGGFGAGAMPGAIHADTEEPITDCLFEKLTFSNLSGWAIKLSVKEAGEISSAGVRIKNCTIADIGGGGIQIRGFRDSLVQGNTIRRVGRIYFSAIGISIGKSPDCHVAANDLADLPYSAIAAGWGSDTIHIRENKIHNAVNVLNDGGGIYITGNDGALITGNTVSGILQQEGEDIQRNGIYPDEKTTNCLVEGNFVYGCHSALLNHMSQGNIIRNNVFISLDGPVMLSFIRCQGYVFEKNTVHARDEAIFAHRRDAFAVFTENLVYSGTGIAESVYVADDYTRSKPENLNPLPGNEYSY